MAWRYTNLAVKEYVMKIERAVTPSAVPAKMKKARRKERAYLVWESADKDLRLYCFGDDASPDPRYVRRIRVG